MEVGNIPPGRPWLYDGDIKLTGKKNVFLSLVSSRNLSASEALQERCPFAYWSSAIQAKRRPASLLGLSCCGDQRDPELRSNANQVVWGSSKTFFLPIFPALWQIQRIIDLVPGAAVPSLQHCRLIAAQSEDLRQQATGLLSKEFINESKSPRGDLAPEENETWRMCVGCPPRYLFRIPRSASRLEKRLSRGSNLARR